ncbi:Sec-independent protein translocase subunit TatA/TatB [Meiothermus taiwanensis]|uniref:Sec-independent protein translocase protein TatA n=2 Tax=Meiothermus taiwanensis TaxID=172827 RepID=A0A399DUX3_9DEIN|nr:twin-arginine translocase TatA/TatE family subunit [Meiothermus taiwanensis]AWR87158.1 twin-arginine translocation protein, TatA/E family subunit [Meiothermus taiwanensis WR-220]AWR88082.1 twin-arginine translocation protein, TatA/E family subunit [Meiothermus taiwanensis WR-220]KIQ53292.1 translocase [Meiothermus taiwanensis]KZK16513.1 translocase [Meiothermus taiwanensis]RIH74091.1 Sec-independent protein translocase protein TatAy [Meiothermus taiwanensis]
MNLGFPEIAVILLVALLLFGPRKLPELARGLGEAIREFKKGASAIHEEVPKPLDLSAQQNPQKAKLER